MVLEERARERIEAMQGRKEMEGVRPTKLIEVSFHVLLHDLKWGRGGITMPTKITM